MQPEQRAEGIPVGIGPRDEATGGAGPHHVTSARLGAGQSGEGHEGPRQPDRAAIDCGWLAKGARA